MPTVNIAGLGRRAGYRRVRSILVVVGRDSPSYRAGPFFGRARPDGTKLLGEAHCPVDLVRVALVIDAAARVLQVALDLALVAHAVGKAVVMPLHCQG